MRDKTIVTKIRRRKYTIDKSSAEGKHENRKLLRRQTAKEARDKIYGQYLED